MSRLFIISLLLLLSAPAQAEKSFANSTVVSDAERQSAPDFISERLQGGKAGLADYNGKLVLLNFWATWCIPCREEMPGMETLWQKYKEQGLVILAVSVDEGSRGRIETFSKMLDISFPILLDPESKVSDLYKVSDMPTSFLIDRNGKIISRIIGTADWYSPEAIRLVEDLLTK